MAKKVPKLILGRILEAIAPRIGAKVEIEPEWRIVGQITFKSGRRRYFHYSSLDLNPLGASSVSKDKHYADFFRKRMGYPTIPGKTFFSKDWAKTIGSALGIDAAYRYAKSVGFPVIVKPNSGSQGKDVALVHDRAEFYAAMRTIFRSDRVALLQQYVTGDDYRIVVLDGRVISAYRRIPLSVIGNGRSSVKRLLEAKQRSFVKAGRDTQLRIDDPRIARKLARSSMTLRSVPAKGEQVFLLDNANLSTGGDAVDVTDIIHPAFRKIAIDLVGDMGLRFCGVDLMVQGPIDQKPKKYWILETNAAPGLDHYAQSGERQKRIVEDLYLEVLKSMDH